jgi:hypothetical protein
MGKTALLADFGSGPSSYRQQLAVRAREMTGMNATASG